jgi:hypothetical protein
MMTEPVKLKYYKYFGTCNLVIALRSYSTKIPTTVNDFLLCDIPSRRILGWYHNTATASYIIIHARFSFAAMLAMELKIGLKK